MKADRKLQERLEAMGEYYAAGLYEEHDATLFERFSRAMRRYLEHYELQQYHGELLYPCGKKWQAGDETKHGKHGSLSPERDFPKTGFQRRKQQDNREKVNTPKQIGIVE